MGATQSLNSNYNQKFSSLEIVKKISESKTLYKSKQSDKFYLTIQHTFATNQQLQFFQKQLRKKNQINHPHYLSSLDSLVITNSNICSKQHKLIQLFSYQSHTLWQEVQNRMMHKKSFASRQIWSILCSCVLAMGQFTRNDICHYTLSPYDIVLNSQGNVKILPMQLSDFIFDYSIKKDYYYSPQMLKAMKCTSQLVLNNKSSVFTLAITILHLLNLKPLNYLYDFDEMSIDFVSLNKLVDSVSDDDIRHILRKMIKPAAYQRITFTQLQDMLYGILQNKGTQSNQISRLEDSICRIVNDLRQSKYNENTSIGSQTMRINFNQKEKFIKKNQIKNSLPLQRQVQDNPSFYTLSFEIDYQKMDQQDKTNRYDNSNFSQFFKANNNIYENVLGDISNFDPSKNSSFKMNDQKSLSLFNPLCFQHQSNSLSNSLILNKNQKKQNSGVYGKYYVTQQYNRGRYQGYKQNGMRHGFGTFYYQEGGKYSGQWYQNKMEGRGALYYTCGNIAYQGQWKKDQLHGQGVLYNQNPRYTSQKVNWQRLDIADSYWVKYQGKFKEDLKHGQGILYFSNGQVFKGFFKDDFPNGQGCFKNNDGNQIKGTWVKGIFQSSY